MESYHDVNGDIGGYLKKDKLWWYFSARDQNIKSLLPNFPVKAVRDGPSQPDAARRPTR